jgi:hypothetical protein
LKKTLHVVLVLGGCAAVAGAALAVATPWGLGISPDSAVYIGAARSLARGHGLTLPADSGTFAPIVHYPPLYPGLLAVLSLGGSDAIAAAKWINVLLFFGNVFLAGVVVYSATGLVLASVTTACLAATAFPMMLIHSMAWSEPLFVLLQSLGILFLLLYFWHSTCRSLLAAAVAMGLSILGRYAGLSLVASGMLGILFLGAAGIKQRLRDAGIFLAVGLVPIGLWVIRNQRVGGTATNRTIGFHPAGFDQISDFIDTVGSWFLAFWVSSREIQLLSLCGVAFAGLLVWLLSQTIVARAESTFTERLKAVLFLTTFVVANYLLLLFVSISLLDVQIPLDSRMLSPCYIPSVLFVVSGVTFLTRREQKSLSSRLIVPVLALSAMGIQLPASLNWLRQLHWEGVGYSSRPWKESETIKRLATLSPSHSIYSNAPDVVYTLLGSPATMIPRKTNTDSNLPNPDYRVQIEQMERELQTTNGVLVFFDRVNWRSYLPSAEELQSLLGLRLMLKTADGSVYQAR